MSLRNIRSLSALFFLTTLSVAFAAETQGPAFGGNRYQAAITSTETRADADDYVASLLQGEKLTVTVKTLKGSLLQPAISLVAPDGAVIDESQLAAKAQLGGVAVKKFAIPRTGRWTVRVSGRNGTSGGYTVAFQTTPAPAVVMKNITLADVGESIVPFEAVDDATLDLKITWKGKTAPVSLASISDPSQHAVSGAVGANGKNSLSLKGLVLRGGDGTYRLHLSHPAGASLVTITLKVTAKGRPAGAKPVVLTDAEPWLDTVVEPVRGIPGRTVRFTGGNFSESSPPAVLFDDVPAAVTVLPGGTAIDVVPPQIAPGTLCAVSVVAADGQACVTERYFYCAPLPVFGDVVNVAGRVVHAFPAAGGNTLFIRGSNFDPGTTVRFGTTPATLVERISPARLRVVVPASADPVRLTIEDPYGRTVDSPDVYPYIGAPTVTGVTASGPESMDATHVAVGGGAVVAIDGLNLDSGDAVTIGGRAAPFLAATATGITVTAPAGTAGLASLVVSDDAGQTATLNGALRFVGFSDPAVNRAPIASPVDDLRAVRGAFADLDNDGTADDLVLVSDGAPSGSRQEMTRVLTGQSGRLMDVTGTSIPGAYTDPAGADSWQAHAVLATDVDGDGVADLVLGGAPVTDIAGTLEARFLLNDGGGTFAPTGLSPLVRTAPWEVLDTDDGLTYPLLTPGDTNGGSVTALAYADVDGDGASDLIVATDHFRTGSLHVALDSVEFSGDDATSTGLAMNWDPVGTQVDTPALRVFLNRTSDGAGFVDASFTRIPRGAASPGFNFAYHARDMKVVDVDGDGSQDIVVSFDNPRRTTPYGLTHTGGDVARIATRILLNDGKGFFTDATDDWLPAASGAEHWQSDRLEMTDLNADGKPDMVLVSTSPIDSYLGTRTYNVSALRILRNDGKGTGFTDVTASALPGVPLAGSADDNLRGTTVAVADVDGDGVLDLLVGTTEAMTTPSGAARTSIRLLHGNGDMTYADMTAFMPSVASDTGEASDLLVADLAGNGTATLIPLTMTQPAKSKSNAMLRFFDWAK